MEDRLNSGALPLERLPTLGGVDSSKLASIGNPAPRLGFVGQPPVRVVGHAYQGVAPVQPTPQPDLAFFEEMYFPSSRDLEVRKVELPAELLESRPSIVSPDLAPREASERPAIYEPQEFALLEVADSNAELVDGRTRTVIPIVAPEHCPVDLAGVQTLGIDSSSLILLSHLSLLGKALTAFDHIKFPSNIERHFRRQQCRDGSQHPALDRQAGDILSVIKSALDEGTASLLSAAAGTDGEGGSDAPSETASNLIARAYECDAVCIDDASHNRRNAIQPERGGEVSVACVLDVLRRLREIESITDSEYWSARHKLRQGGFAVVLPEPDELHHWLAGSIDESGSVLERFELRTIRQSAGNIARGSASGAWDVSTLAIPAIKSCVESVTRLWADESVPTEHAAAQSDWIWAHASPLNYCGEGTGLDSGATVPRSVMVRLLAYLLIPKELPEERQREYSGWIEDVALEVFRPANMDVVDQALKLLVKRFASDERHEKAFGHAFLVQLPASLSERVLRGWPDIAQRWGFGRRRWISFDQELRMPGEGFIAAARQAYSQGAGMPLPGADGSAASICIEGESQALVVMQKVAQRQQRIASLPHFALLSGSATDRVAAARIVREALGATSEDFRELISAVESRRATDDEIDRITYELANGVASSQRRLYEKIAGEAGIGIDDLVPSDLTYFDRFVGPQRPDLDADEYVRKILIPYRAQLLERDLQSALEVACMGFLRDDLAPGAWITDVGNDDVWEALERSGCTGSPIALLGALDIALHRQEDSRFERLATDAIRTLADESFGRSDGFDIYNALSEVTWLALNRIGTLESGALQAGYWRRMGAWMQAGLFVGHLTRSRSRPNMDQFREFIEQHRTIGGWLTQCVDARREPLVLTGRTRPERLRSYVIERLLQVRWRQEGLGHRMPEVDGVDPACWHPRSDTQPSSAGLLGPLDVNHPPSKPLPSEWSNALESGLQPAIEGFPWIQLSTLSRLHELEEKYLEACRTAARMLGEADCAALEGLVYASQAAAACRDPLLADAIADAFAGLATKMDEPWHVSAMTGALVQCAAAHGDEGAWAEWLGARLARAAECLPAAPSTMSLVFRDCLNDLGHVLPAAEWIQLRARAIAACIAPSSPLREDSLPNGWLEESLSDLDAECEAGREEGVDLPGETALQSAREFLKSLATVIRQSPDVAAMADGAIGIDFRNQTTRGGVWFAIEGDGSGACYTLANGVSKRFIRGRHEQLLDDEIRTAIADAGVG